mmetsp:Transcript_6909/g.17465  ORF Transcript_6909/g.17465 Transcript_6909/m.17465 type:complete len:618 (-) Transcript_6909:701-2554(-)
MGKKKGSAHLNPADALRKKEKQKEIKKNKKDRQKVRELSAQKRNPQLILEEIKKLESEKGGRVKHEARISYLRELHGSVLKLKRGQEIAEKRMKAERGGGEEEEEEKKQAAAKPDVVVIEEEGEMEFEEYVASDEEAYDSEEEYDLEEEVQIQEGEVIPFPILIRPGQARPMPMPGMQQIGGVAPPWANQRPTPGMALPPAGAGALNSGSSAPLPPHLSPAGGGLMPASSLPVQPHPSLGGPMPPPSSSSMPMPMPMPMPMSGQGQGQPRPAGEGVPVKQQMDPPSNMEKGGEGGVHPMPMPAPAGVGGGTEGGRAGPPPPPARPLPGQLGGGSAPGSQPPHPPSHLPGGPPPPPPRSEQGRGPPGAPAPPFMPSHPPHPGFGVGAGVGGGMAPPQPPYRVHMNQEGAAGPPFRGGGMPGQPPLTAPTHPSEGRGGGGGGGGGGGSRSAAELAERVIMFDEWNDNDDDDDEFSHITETPMPGKAPPSRPSHPAATAAVDEMEGERQGHGAFPTAGRPEFGHPHSSVSGNEGGVTPHIQQGPTVAQRRIQKGNVAPDVKSFVPAALRKKKAGAGVGAKPKKPAQQKVARPAVVNAAPALQESDLDAFMSDMKDLGAFD